MKIPSACVAWSSYCTVHLPLHEHIKMLFTKDFTSMSREEIESLAKPTKDYQEVDIGRILLSVRNNLTGVRLWKSGRL